MDAGGCNFGLTCRLLGRIESSSTGGERCFGTVTNARSFALGGKVYVTAIVTGGPVGILCHFARALVQAGARVMIADIVDRVRQQTN